MTTIRLQIPKNGLDSAGGAFELAGAVDWLQDMVPYIAQAANYAVETLKAGAETRIAVGKELSAGLEAMNAGESYEGQFVTVTRKENSDGEMRDSYGA